ncbi:oxidoreductase [Candidatus Roizmanbacteria bacterium RIFCSPHIGHO2_01_FULL_39_8]|uniref:Oxidoreductase n=3 Tax=Candidatus Roizmaniibacteriota TaxID=1752723 RepID=A0A1F7GT43_9BACT|nr:MAG: oxidoreductase [Candidatus Roizmanbacteria bacterium RIFCSPHIGHO2_01_FULL_39_8]OGK28095.1 MAG: oxidoreductase [Candidatus Roizmanbacteria bacterium RIFCSPHIGHO2_02_FULL_39_9]OGK34966.1 MAG: oxidoreductase [Candidatus Roizmanbacteria bacterium RIFCSPHIGHO2_12_FULL_39_8]
MVTIGVIGYGYWGPNLVRNFFSLSSCRVKTISDSIQHRLDLAKKYYPSIQTTTDVKNIFKDSSVDAVVIATPISSHFSLVKEALLNNKHVLVEKPMTASLHQAKKLVELARSKKRLLMVDHTFLYTDAVQKIMKLLAAGEIGKVRYFDSTRTNLGLFQADVSVLWDLAVHDISLLLYFIKERPISIQASGASHTENDIENIAFITLKYKSGFIAHINCSWSSPLKIRMILIGGTRKMIVYNDVEPTEKVKLYDSGYSLHRGTKEKKFIVDYRVGDVYIPKIELFEGLSKMAQDFIQSIKTKNKPISSAMYALEVVKVLSLAEKSIKTGERPIQYK